MFTDHLARQYADGRRVIKFFALAACLRALSTEHGGCESAEHSGTFPTRATYFAFLLVGTKSLLQRCWSMARLSSRWLLFSPVTTGTLEGLNGSC